MSKKKTRQPLSDGPEWTFELLETYEKEIARVAEHYRLGTIPIR